MEEKDLLLSWAVELQALAQAGLYYTKDIFDAERFQRIREIAAQILSLESDMPQARLRELFFCEEGYQTPKLDCRAAVFHEGRVQLVQERSGLWALPGGWVDVGLTLAQAAVKEAWEEAGIRVRPLRLVAVLDKDRNNPPIGAHKICKAFFLCEYLGGSFQQNSETAAAGWFPLEDLPPMDSGRSTREEILLCYKASQAKNWETVYDE